MTDYNLADSSFLDNGGQGLDGWYAYSYINSFATAAIYYYHAASGNYVLRSSYQTNVFLCSDLAMATFIGTPIPSGAEGGMKTEGVDSFKLVRECQVSGDCTITIDIYCKWTNSNGCKLSWIIDNDTPISTTSADPDRNWVTYSYTFVGLTAGDKYSIGFGNNGSNSYDQFYWKNLIFTEPDGGSTPADDALLFGTNQ